MNLPFGVWEMTLQALQRKKNHICTTWYPGFYRYLPRPYSRLLFMDEGLVSWKRVHFTKAIWRGRGWGVKITSDSWTLSGSSGLQGLLFLISGALFVHNNHKA